MNIARLIGLVVEVLRVKSLSFANCAAKQLCLGGGKLDFSEICLKHS